MKRIKLMILVLALCFTSFYVAPMDAKAQDVEEDIDFSFLLTEETLVGYMDTQTRGVYLVSGRAFINDAGGGKIGCGGITSAAVKCKVSVNCIIERKVSGSWVRVTSWTATNASAYSISTSKEISVGSGYYYRCRGVHRASTDVGYSTTSSLWM